jgi:hypothetical protein
MTARDDYPYSADLGTQARVEQHDGMCHEIDRLRGEIERCELRNEGLRKICDDAMGELREYRKLMRSPKASR